MTQTELAKHLDKGLRTIKSYESGERPIPKTVEMAIRLLKKEFKS